MAKRIVKHQTKDTYFKNTYNKPQSSSILMYSSPAPQSVVTDSREAVHSTTSLPPLADINTLLNQFDFNAIETYLAQEVVADYGNESNDTAYDNDNNHSLVEQGHRYTKREVIYRPLAEALLLHHNAALVNFVSQLTEARRQQLMKALIPYEGFWNQNKIQQVKLSINGFKLYATRVSREQYDPKGKEMTDHANLLLGKLEKSDISFNAKLQKNFDKTVEMKRESFGKHRHIYRELALHIAAILATAVIGYAAAFLVSRLLTGKWNFLHQTRSERNLDNIKSKTLSVR